MAHDTDGSAADSLHVEDSLPSASLEGPRGGSHAGDGGDHELGWGVLSECVLETTPNLITHTSVKLTYKK